jgi:hypothetical protein
LAATEEYESLTEYPSDFTGLDWWSHGQLLNYDMPNPAEGDISQWLIANPNRLNLGRIGLHFGNDVVEEKDLNSTTQLLDIWTGKLVSYFIYSGTQVNVSTVVDPHRDVMAITIESDLLSNGRLGLFFDFPYPDLNKFDAPFVGIWNNTEATTSLSSSEKTATIQQKLNDNTNYLHVEWNGSGQASGPLPGTNKYLLTMASGQSTLHLTAFFTSQKKIHAHERETTSVVEASAAEWWRSYWNSGAFVDLSLAKQPDAIELQRRIILSQYLLAVNCASDFVPQGKSDFT